MKQRHLGLYKYLIIYFGLSFENIIYFIKQKLGMSMRRLKQKANDLLQHIFYFDRPWDMEQDLKPVEMEHIDWSFKTEDEEWTYMLNRMEYLIDLCLYSRISMEQKYNDKINYLINDWIEKNNLEDYHHRTLDTGVRLLSWSFVLSENMKANTKIINSINKQVTYLTNNYRLKDDLSNWGLFQSIGVLSCSEYLDSSSIKWWRAKLFTQLDLQITNDGSHWENSIMYHNQILGGLCRLHDANKNLNLIKWIDKLALYTYKTCKPNYHQISQNDSDDTDVSGLLAYAYFITKNDTYKFKLIDEELKVLCMAENVINPKLKDVSKLYKNAGLSVYRKNCTYMSAHNQPYGSSHSHLMWGHVNFYCDGDILIDPGRFTYVDNWIRKELKSITSHNCVFNKDKYHENIINSWDSDVNGYAISTEKYNIDNIDVTIMNYSIDNQVNTRYTILLDDQLLIFDRVCQKSGNVIEANFIFAPDIYVEDLMIKSKKYRIIHNYEKYKHKKQLFSPKYNELDETTKINFTTNENELFYYQGLVKLNSAFNQVYSDDNSKAFRIQSKYIDYIIYLCPIEIKIGAKVKNVCNYSVYGQLMIINQSTGKKHSIKL